MAKDNNEASKIADQIKDIEIRNSESILDAKLKELDDKLALLNIATKDYENKKQELDSTISTFTQTKEVDKKALEKEALSVGAVLGKENKITIVVPKSELNPKDKMVPVTINGFTYQIKRGDRVEVPMTVYEILKEAKYI